jgi:hypothetical protein
MPEPTTPFEPGVLAPQRQITARPSELGGSGIRNRNS